MTTALEKLAERLRVPVEEVPALTAYDDEQAAAYLATVERAMAREEHALTDAIEESLGYVPRLLRPAAKKLLGGGRG